MNNEVLFTYNDTRCHATIVNELSGDEIFIGEIEGFYIWQINKSGLFDQFGFVAVEKDFT